jgi:uncharacterized membrane protein
MNAAIRGTWGRMALENDHTEAVRAVRQLRQIRAFYASGAVLWAASAAWAGWRDPGGRQMWVSVLLLAVFTGLLAAAQVWLRRQRTAGNSRTVHHAAPRHPVLNRHANA